MALTYEVKHGVWMGLETDYRKIFEWHRPLVDSCDESDDARRVTIGDRLIQWRTL